VDSRLAAQGMAAGQGFDRLRIHRRTAEVATTAVELFRASLEYIDLFTYLIMCTKPVDAPNAVELLGKVTDTGYRPPEPHPTEVLYRQLFRWD
jgi:hypothetical protein